MNRKAFNYRYELIIRKLKRMRYWLKSSIGNREFDYHNVPVIINNRNRLRYLMELLSWLEKAGMKNILIIDNNSDYPPLLEYYNTSKYNIYKAGANVGYRALWLIPELKYLLSDYYVYTDPDVVPVDECPTDVVNFMYRSLKNNFLIDKIGLGLKIDDLPDHNILKTDIINWEKQFWNHPVNPFLYRAKVDTTFALYSPFAEGGGECKAYRTGAPYVARHLPWYENSLQSDSEQKYYKENSEAFSTHWTLKKEI